MLAFYSAGYPPLSAPASFCPALLEHVRCYLYFWALSVVLGLAQLASSSPTKAKKRKISKALKSRWGLDFVLLPSNCALLAAGKGLHSWAEGQCLFLGYLLLFVVFRCFGNRGMNL